jgi:dolichol kinase
MDSTEEPGLAEVEPEETTLEPASEVLPIIVADGVDKTDSSYNNSIRRWFHLITISIFGLVYGLSAMTWQTVLFPLTVATMVIIGLDLLRIHIGHLNWLVQNTFSFMLRKHEFHALSGMSWFMLGAMICIVVFPKVSAMLGFLYLAFGDPTASYVGIRWGNKGIGNKTWIGSLGFFIICMAIGFPWFLAITTWQNALIISGVPAFISAVVERNLKEMDDNLVIPITTSLLVTFLMAILL